jgi:hypothetical protein
LLISLTSAGIPEVCIYVEVDFVPEKYSGGMRGVSEENEVGRREPRVRGSARQLGNGRGDVAAGSKKTRIIISGEESNE